ncbi:Mitochondrial inner membrane protease atp23 [Elasticomyces elasticus]|nr:Mitochondrial inner membrane protease atp23 [Elasticomyces elasticus]
MVNADLIEASQGSKPQIQPHFRSRPAYQYSRPMRPHLLYRPFPTSSASQASATSIQQQATSRPPSISQNVASTKETPDFLPSTSTYNRFLNFYRMATGSMSEAGQKQYWADADSRYSKIDCERCESHRDYLLKYSPIVRYMSDNIAKLGGVLDQNNIRCRTCSTGQLGGFDAKYGIMLCANWLDTRNKVEDVLSHEMVHAYDHMRFDTSLGPDEDLRKVACSEIRASNLSGECRWANEFFRNKVFKISRHQEECVKRRAVISVSMRPSCDGKDQAEKVVDSVWDSCFADTRPFDEVFR